MNVLLFILLVTGAVYGLFLAWCWWAWSRLKVETSNQSLVHELVTVVVPARNESRSIVSCLESLAAQDYPNLEVIVADDDSKDETPKLVEDFFSSHPALKGRIIRLGSFQNEKGLYKKRAITTAVNAANGAWIITTDADCMAAPGWISSMMEFAIRKQAVFVAGPVVMVEEKTLLQKMQSLEFTGLVGLGAASLSMNMPMMCNGANIAYTKHAFHACGGYAGDAQASGDDTSLLYAMHEKFPGKVVFLKSVAAIIKTKPQSSAQDLLQQRIRWSSKIPQASNGFTRTIAACAFLFHALILVAIFIPATREIALGAWLLKSLVEWEFLKRLITFFDKRSLLLFFPLAQIIYPLYIVLTGLFALRGEYSWKGRRQVV